jgi:hypothetical protein
VDLKLPQVDVLFSPFNCFVHVKTVSARREFGKNNVSFLSIPGVQYSAAFRLMSNEQLRKTTRKNRW